MNIVGFMKQIGLRRARLAAHAVMNAGRENILLSLPCLVSTTGSIIAASRISPEERFISEKGVLLHHMAPALHVK
ncbi:hypothetical protein V6617_18580 (plasmid) [Pelagibacterium nitratireducens]|uniref:Uncharacterized protein n=1 Tax=Pelagibacterium nitratireducens TaxID=1046114 RepID=A0ABZ2I534_9HYPH